MKYQVDVIDDFLLFISSLEHQSHNNKHYYYNNHNLTPRKFYCNSLYIKYISFLSCCGAPHITAGILAVESPALRANSWFSLYNKVSFSCFLVYVAYHFSLMNIVICFCFEDVFFIWVVFIIGRVFNRDQFVDLQVVVEICDCFSAVTICIKKY